jgi:hypothetical protein
MAKIPGTAILAALLLGGCGDAIEPPVPAAVQVSRSAVEVQHGETVTLTATIVDQRGSPMAAPPGLTIVWSSEQPGVATVTGGVVRGEWPGETSITASAGSLPAAVVQVQVTPAARVPSGVAVVPGGTQAWYQSYAAELELGGSMTFTAVVLDQYHGVYSTPPAGFAISWSTVNPGVAAVEDGTVRATGVGQTWVQARAGTLQPATVQVRVEGNASLHFEYDGHRTGSFALDATFVQMVWGRDWSWAATFHDSGSDTQDIIAQRLRPGGRVDLLWIFAAGRVSAPRTAELQTGDGWLLLGLNPLTGDYEGEYELVSGSIAFDSVTAHRMAGTLTMVLEDLDDGEELIVTDGIFDLPIVDQDAPVLSARGTGSGAGPLRGERGAPGNSVTRR